MSRGQGEYIGVEEKLFDRIDIKFDINSFQGNQENRFEIAAVEMFFKKVLEIRKQLVENLGQKIHG